MTNCTPLAGRRISTAALLAGALALPAPRSHAIDWDGDFPNTGNFNGKIDAAENWDFNIVPGPGVGAEFSANATYTIDFNTDFETASASLTAGDVTFRNLGAVRDYTINGNFTVSSMLTLDGVNLDSGQNIDLFLSVEDDAEMLIQNGTTSRVGAFRVGTGTSDGTLTLDGGAFEMIGVSGLIIGAGPSGGLFTLQNSAAMTSTNGSLIIARGSGLMGTVEITDGSSIVLNGLLGMADLFTESGSAVLELSGAGSRLELTAGNDAQVGASALSTARLTAGSGTYADFGGALRVRATGTFENLGAAVSVDGTALIDGVFEQTAGSTVFNGTADFGSGATFVHFGGSIQFRDASTFGFSQDITIGGPTVGNAATWDVDADVAFTQRLRLAGDTGTFASITVADIGGTDAVLRNTGTGGAADLAVGFNGSAQLFVSDTGLVDIFDDVIIGQNAGSVGQVFVTGDGTFNPADRSTLLANRNGSGANLFVGINGSGFLSVAGGGLVEVGNDLVVMAFDEPGVSSTVSVGVDPSLALASIDTVTIGNDLLIGNVGGNGGTSSGLYWQRDRAQTVVGRTTHVRTTGELRADPLSTLTTVNLTTDAGSILDIDGGIVTVDGGTATLNHGDLVINGDTAVLNGQGTLNLNSGADAVLDGELIIANAPGEFGMLRIDGTGSTFNQTGGLKSAFVGAGGLGQMRIINGGFAEINVELFVGQGSTANGTVDVSGVSTGVRSTLVVDNLGDSSVIRIGEDGATSRLDISDGALVQVGGAVFVGNLFTADGNHRFTIGGTQGGFSAELQTKFLTVTGPGASADINNGALISLSSNTPFSQLQAFNGGEINITGGEVFAPQVSRDGGSTINWTGGTLHTEDVMGDLTNAGGTLAPGQGQAVTLGTTTFANDYTQTSAGTIEIEIAGTTQGTEFDFVDVDGQLSLAGTLEVVLLGPTPTAGDTYDILDWTTLSGTFDTLLLPGVGNGNTWLIDNLYTTGTLEVIRSGDLDSDGIVGAADLDIILANWNQSVDEFDESMGDVTGDGFVDDDDLQAVLDQFGDTTYPGSTMVPEPGTLALLVLMGLAGLRRRRR